jgi:Cys-tRNA synthase (O-phospho-L-seryl-tRNA:Cys-tRNA synthase)
MIFKLKFIDDENRIDWCQAKNQLHLLQSYEKEYGELQDIEEVIEISEEDAKTIMLKNTDYDETDPTDTPNWSLFDAVIGDDFCVVGSTEFL